MFFFSKKNTFLVFNLCFLAADALAHYGVTKDGRTVCASVTWNDTKALDEDTLVTPFAGLLQAAAMRAPG